VPSIVIDSAPKQALDSRLSTLLAKEHTLDALPLALRRFARAVGDASATGAMRRAVATLLGEYFGGTAPRGPVSVSRLGRLAGALIEVPVKLTPRRTAYSLGASGRRTHTGTIVFSSGLAKITVPQAIDKATARISVAHEIGHLLIHRRSNQWDDATLRLRSSEEEEALAEYAARLLLMPSAFEYERLGDGENLAQLALRLASAAGVTVHAAVARLGDPDVVDNGVRGAILWRLNPRISASSPLAHRMTPQWHMCPGAFVPVGKCAARVGSLAATIAAGPETTARQCEDVRIGSFTGTFVAHGFAWGSVEDGTRLVLTIYQCSAVEQRTSDYSNSCYSANEVISDDARSWKECRSV
jgi:hypothetical protein